MPRDWTAFPCVNTICMDLTSCQAARGSVSLQLPSGHAFGRNLRLPLERPRTNRRDSSHDRSCVAAIPDPRRRVGVLPNTETHGRRRSRKGIVVPGTRCGARRRSSSCSADRRWPNRGSCRSCCTTTSTCRFVSIVAAAPILPRSRVLRGAGKKWISAWALRGAGYHGRHRLSNRRGPALPDGGWT